MIIENEYHFLNKSTCENVMIMLLMVQNSLPASIVSFRSLRRLNVFIDALLVLFSFNCAS